MIELNRIYTGDCIEVMRSWPENFVDTIITDPPYGIRFMGKAWDGADIEKTIESKRRHTPRNDGRGGMSIENRAFCAGEYDRSLNANRNFQEWCSDWAAAALKIVKPGGIMLVFGGTRTFHRMTSGLEDAGWQIRDCLMWLYGSGFPKSLDISKAIDKSAGHWRGRAGEPLDDDPKRSLGQHYERNPKGDPITATATATAWHGWGTALKPAWEPIIVAMKPIDGTFAENAEKWGVAGLNVDGARIQTADDLGRLNGGDNGMFGVGKGPSGQYGKAIEDQGRWPANLILDEEAAGMLDGMSAGQMHSAGHARPNERRTDYEASGMFALHGAGGHRMGDSGGASRFFYVAKSARAERNEGCEELPQRSRQQDGNPDNWDLSEGKMRARLTTEPQGNHHPTVKPLSLMKYLCNLTRTPTGGIVLDPFAGSGTTLWAAEYHNRPWVGIEMNAEYVAIAQARLARERAQIKMAI